ncbi:MAG TPA: sigma-70 family RNA polymerase sigma factor, partial [Gemmataceae bacterium]|nr:sigma-70 family RNA polymerase sigma factor [Gemmataceae bacterium]
MASHRTDSIIQHLRRAVLRSGAGLSDSQLLESFITDKDAAAFEALVRRHGQMVQGVCLRVLRHRHDAEDAFQATFLVLAHKAASVCPRDMLGNWLYGVANTTALRAKVAAAKRQAREKQVSNMPEPQAPEPGQWDDLQPLLDQELTRLPDKYRIPIVLCDLEGRPRREVASRLKIPEGTLSSRLTTARRLLAKRLSNRGMAVSGAALAALVTQNALSASVPPTLVTATVKAVTLLAAGQAAANGIISAPVLALKEGVLKAMFLNKLKTVTTAL